ncbi:MAG: extracellular solute-binding protein [Chloroflexi bacterium]|nr:extracellular solute-binding protein [Chloroflexota bacterium]
MAKTMKMVSAMVCLLAAMIALLAGVSCSAPAATPTTGEPKAATPAASRPSTDYWQQTWENTVAQAKKEGRLMSYTLWGPEQREALGSAFKQKYGIDIDFMPFQRGAEMLTKLQTERTAGLNLSDFFGVGGATPITLLKPEHLVGPMEPLLILPEVKDPKNWAGNRFPWMDNDKQAIAMIANINPTFVYNTTLVKKGELTGFDDLLKPQYKGKMTLNDPSLAGASSVIWNYLARYVWNPEQAKDFLRKLITEQEVVIQRDLRLHVESVARGKFAIGIGPHPTTTVEFMRNQAPIDVTAAKEGRLVGYGTGGISIAVKPPHPNATRLFVNWVLTKEGQSILAGSYGAPSLRLDASVEGINPIFLPQPGEKLVYESEEDTIFRGGLVTQLRAVIDQATR